MIKSIFYLLFLFFLTTNFITFAQTDSLKNDNIRHTQDSVKIVALQEYEQRHAEIEKSRIADSLKKVDLEIQSRSLKTIFTEWLSNSEFLLVNRTHFEILGEKYKNGDPDSEEEI